MLILWTLFACGGPNAETLLDELRVVHVEAPPEVAPGEAAAIEALTVDPLEAGFETLLWTCTSLGDGCLEGGAPGSYAVGEGPITRLDTVVPPALGGVLGEAIPELPTVIWALSCAPGTCPVIDAARDGSTEADFLEDLADPSAMMGGLPIAGTSLASRFVTVSARAPEARDTNPVVAVTVETDLVQPANAEAEIGRFLLVEFPAAPPTGATAWGYTTRGGFRLPSVDVVDGAARVEWLPGEEPGLAELFVVVVDGEGGSALWRGAGEVTAP